MTPSSLNTFHVNWIDVEMTPGSLTLSVMEMTPGSHVNWIDGDESSALVNIRLDR